MKSIDGKYEDLYVINKSKFYSFAYPVTSEEEVKIILAELRERFADATHICFAYSLSSPRLEKADDNGEPSGTAGKPLLELIKKKNMDNVLVVSVRYFGGIKLGAGGLVRAYNGCVVSALNQAKVVEKCLCKTVLIKADYDKYNLLIKLFTKDCKIISTDWDSGVNLTVAIKNHAYDDYYISLNEMFFGKPNVTILEEGYVLI
jgi:uncharacterized YigZ family protein